MAARTGTLTPSTIRIQDDTIPQPIAIANEILGGWHAVNTLADMGNIPVWLRQFGMAAVVTNDSINNGIYILTLGFVDGNIANNANWKPFTLSGGSSNCKKLDQVILNNGTINLPSNCILFLIMVNAAAELPNFNVGVTNGGGELIMTQDVGAGFSTFQKGSWVPAPTTIYFSGIDTQSTCSVIIFTF